jgi:hypothetical protein
MEKAPFLAIAALLLVLSAAFLLNWEGNSPDGGPDSNPNTGGDIRPINEAVLCLGKPTRETELCYDLLAKEKLETSTTREIMNELEEEVAGDAKLREICHEVAHAIGRVSMFNAKNGLAETFSECTQTCHSGCYHGALQILFLKETLPESELSEYYDKHVTVEQIRERVGTACSELAGRHPYWFQCLHGLGHGVMFNVENNLSLALELCDMLGSEYERTSCYGGAFMENVVSIDKETRDIRLDDPHYPCNRMDQIYKNECYKMQTSVMSEIFGGDIERVIDECKRADGYSDTCFVSLGRERSSLFRLGSGLPFTDLEKIEEEYKDDYIRGMVYALADNTWDGTYAFPFCSKMDDGSLGTFCYETATGYLTGTLGIPRSKIESSCMEHSPEPDLCKNSMGGFMGLIG